MEESPSWKAVTVQLVTSTSYIAANSLGWPVWLWYPPLCVLMTTFSLIWWDTCWLFILLLHFWGEQGWG